MAPRTFQIPQGLSNDSRLLRLPAELRLKILRFLLCSGEPLHPIEATIYDVRQSQIGFVALDSQILRASQELYTEGYEILCKNNTLGLILKYCDEDDGPLLFTVMKVTVEMVHSDSELLPQDSSLLDGTKLLLEPEFDDLRWDKAQSLQRQSLRDLYPVLTRFASFHVRLDSECCTDVNLVSRLLQRLLWNRDVTLELIPQIDMPLSQGMRSCRFLRCRTFRYIGVPENNDSCADVATITGHQDVHDTFKTYQQFSEEVLDKLMLLNGESFRDEHWNDLLRPLDDAAREYELENFEHLMGKALNAVSAWSEKWLAEQTAKLLPSKA